MKVNYQKVNIILARKGISLSALRMSGMSASTLRRVANGFPIAPRLAGKLANALGVDIAEIAEVE